MAKVRLMKRTRGVYEFYCPGCKCMHQVWTHKDDGVETWGFNGDVEKPTFTPSIKVLSYVGKSVSGVCHSQITDGKIFFYNDSTHELSSQEELLTDL